MKPKPRDKERQSAIRTLRKKFQDLHGEAYEKNRDLAQARGREFERLVCAVFRAWGMLERGPYHTGDNKSEQIDGVLRFDNRYALLEAKWEKARLAASELFSFLGKVDGKFSGTIGVFVSRKELTTNFLNALRAGRRQCIIVIHGQDVDDLFDPAFDLAGYLERHLLTVCTDNLCHLSTQDYVAKLKTPELKKKAAAAASDVVEAKIEECLNDETVKNIVNEFAEELNLLQRVDALQLIVKNYADIASSPSGEEAWRGENLHEFLKELVKRLPDSLTQAEETFFMDKLSKDFQSPHYRPMTEYFARRYKYLPAEAKKKCEERLVHQWDKIIGDWPSENRMAEATRPLWGHLGPGTKKHLIKYFIEFVLSLRGTRFPQYELAHYVLWKKNSVTAAEEFLRKRAKKVAKTWIEEEDTGKTNLVEVEESVTSAIWSMREYIPDFENLVKAAVREAADECKATRRKL